MTSKFIVVTVLAALSMPAAFADELTEIIQKDLVALGYDPGNTDGDATTDTVIAISKFQSENSLDVTGQPTPQLAGIIKSKLSPKMNGSAETATAHNPAELELARQNCIRDKMAAAQESKKKKRGFGRLLSAATRTVTSFGGAGAMGDISRTTRDIYNVNATAEDLQAAAKDLGLTEDDLEACRNPAS